MNERYLCVHGHFYQPPRENPWLEAIEVQDSAYPYHDWNERITAECYGPNGASRILDGEGRITRIVNNYSRISYNFGPTVLAWMAAAEPEAYRRVIEADRQSAARFGGHGSAMAQVYNHVIMPLASRRDKQTQIAWGIADFRHRFGRMPEGMWLAETAVDVETLELLAEAGITFTVLAPHQAGRVRRIGEDGWRDTPNATVDPTRTYVQRLPSGREISLFFYDGPISRAIAFEGLLARGESLAERLLGAFAGDTDHAQLVHIATDGETYGHHHPYGDMALAYALDYVESNNLARVTNYGEFLALFPPEYEAEIIENTSWSCIHGIERWRGDCGCNSGGRPGWHQGWRGPLRNALDTLRDAVELPYEEQIGAFVRDPWAARDDYIRVVLDRSEENVSQFIADHTLRDLTEPERIALWELLEMQRHALLMYTSCGWFFDELSGLETVQIMEYAGRVIQLAQRLFAGDHETAFLTHLVAAQSNIPEFGGGHDIYLQSVKPATVDTAKVAAHFAISSLFEHYTDETRIYSYRIHVENATQHEAGRSKLAVGRARFTSRITGETDDLTYAVFGLGDHNITCGVQPFDDDDGHQTFAETVTAAFNRVDFSEVIRLLDRRFGEQTYALKSLFRDEQRKILRIVLDSTLAENEAMYRQIYENRTPLMRFLSDLSAPLPAAFRTAAEFVLDTDLRRVFESDMPDPDRVRVLLEGTNPWGVQLDTTGLSYIITNTVGRLVTQLAAAPSDMDAVVALAQTVEAAQLLPFAVSFAGAQNTYYTVLNTAYLEQYAHARRGDETAQAWVGQFLRLGERLNMDVREEKLAQIRTTPSMTTALTDALASARVPRATYRLQFNKTFTFADALRLVPYLDALGISEVYASPILTATPGSMHGYDIIDHGALNPEIGTEEEFNRLADALRERGIGLILDMVPNHMGIGDAGNGWWQDVLENGPASVYAAYFDIDWHPVKRELANKVLLPILGDQYGKVLEDGGLRLAYADGAFSLHYYETALPVEPQSYAVILADALDNLRATLEEGDAHVQELQSILTALSYLPPTTETDAERMAERNREKEVIKRRIAALLDTGEPCRDAVHTSVETFNTPTAYGIDRMDTLLSAQAYRPAFWRVATEEINYRRFFDINGLAAIRMEDPAVFKATHALLLRLLAEGKATGMRIDHPDGLRDPAGYFRQLQTRYVIERVRARVLADELPEDAAQFEEDIEERLTNEWGDADTAAWPLYVVAEKILAEDEPLPPSWAIAGTTGYDFLNEMNGIFVRTESKEAFDRIFTQFAGEPLNFRNLTNRTKKMIMLVSLASEINALAYQLERIAERSRAYRDFTLNSLTFALREVIACLPVYRTYTTETTDHASDADARYVEEAVAEAKQRNPRTATSIFDFLRDTLLLRNRGAFRSDDHPALLAFVLKWQQVTGPVMAKGVEDTAFYVYNRLVSLNEVGGHPSHFGHSVAAFHTQNANRRARWQHSMIASATHDTKRGEDTRARINVLSEMPDEWDTALTHWGALNAPKKALAQGEPAPDRKDEYLLYQIMLGTWPTTPMDADALAIYRARVAEYMLKAIKEAKAHTSWVNPNDEYDRATGEFVARLLPDDPTDFFLADFAAFAAKIAGHGQWNSLSQTLLKLTAPGVPDIYQGTELWDFSLVDPDNRRPVDYDYRTRSLDDLARQTESDDARAALARALVETSADGCIKLYLTHAALAHRRAHPALFAAGDYTPLDATGAKAAHLCAYARTHGDETMLVIVPRLTVGLTGSDDAPPVGSVWAKTRLIVPESLAGATFRNILTGEIIAPTVAGSIAGLSVAAALAHFPVALLERVDTVGDAGAAV